ncbi:MAG TPA: J domain-containing protein [Clostridiales bacterium]|nr:J domain-containing protein [Clostridiales bacterium]
MDPYEILGITPSSTDEEIKIAYRKRAFEVTGGHMGEELPPDIAAKVDELNAAYDNIIDSRRGNNAYSYSSTGSYGNYSQFYIDLRQKLRAGNYDEVEGMLQSIPENERSGEWYYIYAQVTYKKGRFTESAEYAKRACDIDSTNPEYSDFYRKIQADAAGGYRQTQISSSDECCKLCAFLSCLDCCCESTGNDCIPCC